MKYQVILLTAVFFVFFTAGLSADAADNFALGVEAYNSGDYEQAVQIFKEIEDSGYVSPELYYNLGNSYYKAGQKGMAISSYMQAEILSPRSEDIEANLQFVRSTLRDKVEDSLRNPIWQFVKESSLYFKADELTWIAFIIYLLIIGLLIYQVFYKQKNIAYLLVITFAAVLLIISISLLGINLKLNYY
ncbi:MAG: hypothetical protein GWO41_17270, partial [candidate division Zixibacteria bacterium]|nr:hypothetical protein [candidate division Zixibacteria bacterium]NIR63575.1 hypothetical protein [candidate division Zixibacteria bacterium]NIS18176.1 hypothetical protein [candidate division Zixibacteria bacterium]NIS45539.1 hypothetical protein [candidate division Zixibacteria bacterium]NIT54444.1 hypothetical protein [candidate division Zixibacteria bacterium]